MRSGKELYDPYKTQKPDTSDKEGSSSMEEENEDGCMELRKPTPQHEPTRYVPKLIRTEAMKEQDESKVQIIFEYFQKLTINI